MAVEGSLDLFKLPEILQMVSQQKKTGILTVQGQQDIVAISFLNGRIVAADALNQTMEEGLSQVLHKEGMISAPDLARAAAEHQASGGRLIDLLVERRYIERSQLLEALRLQTWRLLEQLLRWREGDFKFYSGDEVSYEEGFDPISVEELLVHAAPSVQAEMSAAARAPAPAPAPAPRPAPAPPAAPVARPAPTPSPSPSVIQPPVQPVRPPQPAPAPAPRLQAVPRPTPAVTTAVLSGEETATSPFIKMKVEPRPAPPPSLGWVSRTLAILFAALVVVALVRSPGSILFPFPWEDPERENLAREQRTSLDLKIDQAAKTWFLLKGSFPDRLEDLVAAGLLSPSDLRDSLGRPFLYAASEESYTVQPVQDGKPLPDAGTTEAITGNFLLDPEFLNVSSETNEQPLVLLD